MTAHQFVNMRQHQRQLVLWTHRFLFECVYVHECTGCPCHGTCVEVRGKLVLVGSPPWAVSLGCKHLDPLRHLTGPTLIIFTDALLISSFVLEPPMSAEINYLFFLVRSYMVKEYLECVSGEYVIFPLSWNQSGFQSESGFPASTHRTLPMQWDPDLDLSLFYFIWDKVSCSRG